MKKDKKKIDDEIKNVGESIINSETFQAATKQVHHGATTVSAHTLSVTRKAVALCDVFESMGKNVNREKVILGALCHDLGILGRNEKFSGKLECWSNHPKFSVEEARKLIPDMDEKLENIIKNHMWPLSGKAPSSIEETIVIMADKAASVTDLTKAKKLKDEGGFN